MKPFEIDLFSIVEWLHSHPCIKDIELTFPRIDYQGFQQESAKDIVMPHLKTVYIGTIRSHYFDSKGFVEYLLFLTRQKAIKTMNVSFFISNCTFHEVDNIILYLSNMEFKTLIVEINADGFDIKELLKFRDLIRSIKTLEYFWLYSFKKNFIISKEIVGEFVRHFSVEKQKLGKFLIVTIDSESLI